MQTRIDRGTISSLKAIITYFENQGVDNGDEEADQRLMMLSHVERNMAECEKTLLAYQRRYRELLPELRSKWCKGRT